MNAIWVYINAIRMRHASIFMDPTTANVIRASKATDSDFVTRHVLWTASMESVPGFLIMCVTVILAGLARIVIQIVAVTITARASQGSIIVTLVRTTQWDNFVKFATLELLGMQQQKLGVNPVGVTAMLI